jgi:DNA-binding transcriptional ArsR family regulator
VSSVFEEITKLDRLIHEPARLAILTALNACQKADFTFLRRLTGLSAGNLSVQLSKLETAGLLIMDKKIKAKRTHTMVTISPTGVEAVKNYWYKMETLQAQANDFKIDQD